MNEIRKGKKGVGSLSSLFLKFIFNKLRERSFSAIVLSVLRATDCWSGCQGGLERYGRSSILSLSLSLFRTIIITI